MQKFKGDIQTDAPELPEVFEGLSESERLEAMFNAEAIQDRIEAEAMKKAQKLIRKNKREITRLKKHAGECVLNGNYFGYQYAVKKLRDFYRQPYTDELVLQMWNSTRQAVIDIASKTFDDEVKKLK